MATQLKTFIPLGTATRKVRREKTTRAVSLMPLVNMWWAQTRDPTDAIATLENAIALYPKIVLLAKVGMISDTAPIAGSIMIYTAGWE